MAADIMPTKDMAANDSQNDSQNAPQPNEWLLIGRILGAHGLNGHVKVYPESDFPERFTQSGDRWLRKPNGEPVQVKLTSGRYLEGKNQYLVKLEGVNFRDQAEDLRKAELLVKESDRLTLDPGEFHVSDLIGMTVILQADNTLVGTVQDVYTTGHDMLEVVLANQGEPEDRQIKDADAANQANAQPHPSTRTKAAQRMRKKARKGKKKAVKTLLIPFVEEIVPVVDLNEQRIEITPPPGLLDL